MRNSAKHHGVRIADATRDIAPCGSTLPRDFQATRHAHHKSRSSSATPGGDLGEAKLKQVLGYQLAQAAVVTLGVFEDLVGGPLSLRPVEYTMLMLVKENPGGSPAQLAKVLAMTRPNVSLWIEKLEAKGLLSRATNSADRRSQHLHVTKAGDALASKATRRLIDGERDAFTTLSPVEQMMLTELLHKLAGVRRTPPAEVG